MTAKSKDKKGGNAITSRFIFDRDVWLTKSKEREEKKEYERKRNKLAGKRGSDESKEGS